MSILKNLCFSVITLLVTVALAYGQGNSDRESLSGLTVMVSEAGNNEPVQLATVYIVPSGDTVASAFTFTDKKGVAVLKDFQAGSYTVNVQLLGFKPYSKVHSFRARTAATVKVRLEDDVQQLEGASITEMGDLVTVKGDTLIYNATSFRTSNNASLGDLLKKMPGIEVENGCVTVNGEAVKRITVEGKTFFFDDQSKALENLPAFIINKIQVTDKQIPGRGGQRRKEKEMDVKLKEEFKESWFAKASAEGGLSVNDASSNMFGPKIKGLYNAKLYAQYLGDKDDITAIGGANNVNSNKLSRKQPGMSDIGSAGINYNTSRIPNYNTTAAISYDFRSDNNQSVSQRTSFLSSREQIFTRRSQKENDTSHGIKSGFSIGTPLYDYPTTEGFVLKTDISYGRRLLARESTSTGFNSAGEQLNGNNAASNGYSNRYGADINLRSKYFLDKYAKHEISITGALRYDGSNGDSKETSVTTYKSSSEMRSLIYNDKGLDITFNGSVNYVGILSRSWQLASCISADLEWIKDDRNAKNASDMSYNEFYSKETSGRNINLTESVSAAFSKQLGQRKFFNTNFGVSLYEDNIAHFSKAYGSMTNDNAMWTVSAGPDVSLSFRDRSCNYTLYTRGKNTVPSLGATSSPILNISNPSDINTGNIYLRGGYRQDASFSIIHGSSRSGKSYVNLRLMGSVDWNEETWAGWFDDSAVRYSIPVNAKQPRYNANLNITYIQPLDKKKSLSLTITPKASFSSGIMYIAKSPLRGLDTKTFNYAEMMAWFYGDSKGSEFYSGRSGFVQNRNYNINWSLDADLKWEIKEFSVRGGTSIANSQTVYSVSPKVNVNTWKFNANAEILWQNKRGWEVEGRFDFNGYKGFSQGYNTPEYLLNLKVAKAIKSFTLSLSAYDILGSAKSFSHAASAEYIEDTYRNNLGRCIMIGVTYNFGKWDFVKKAKVQSFENNNNL